MTTAGDAGLRAPIMRRRASRMARIGEKFAFLAVPGDRGVSAGGTGEVTNLSGI